MRGLLKDFKEFAFRGNLIEIAVAFVLGLAFAAVVTSFVRDILMNLIAAIAGKPDFSDLTFDIGNGTIRYGAFLTALITFILIAFALFLIVKLVQKLMKPKVMTRDCPNCLSVIPLEATVCSHCTREVSPLV